jgi:hypothetical protein
MTEEAVQGPQMSSANPSQRLALEHSTSRKRVFVPRSTVYAARPYIQPNIANTPAKHQTNTELPSPQISIMLLTTGALRVNTISTFFEVNRRVSNCVIYSGDQY